MPMHNIAADIPPSLRGADELLHRYGRWAMDRARKNKCGSLESNYAPTKGEAFDDRREPREELMHVDAAMVCQRALARVPDKERVVLAIIYVPRKLPPQAQLRMLRIPPRLSQERHLLGLKMFANLHRVLTAR